MTRLTKLQKETLVAINMWGDHAFKHMTIADATTRSLMKRGLITDAGNVWAFRTTTAGATLAASLGTP